MKHRTILGLIAASIAAGVVVVAAAADNKYCANGIWPNVACDANGNPTPELTEWFTDIPWRQKLGTYQGNKIDIAIVLPYDVLRQNAKTACSGTTPPLTEEQCMIEIGVTNIVGTYRSDTKYDPNDPRIKDAKVGKTAYCQDPTLPCIEVKLEVSNWWAQPSGNTLTPGVNTLNKQLFGLEIPPDYVNGFVLTDASVYAPQMPWYMSHYCDSRWNGDSQDPVCYGDYLSPMNSAFNGNSAPGGWPNDGAFSVDPRSTAPAPVPGRHCAEGKDKCTIALAGFFLTPVPSNLKDLQYQTWNDFLIRWFNRALTSFPTDVTDAERERHFAWVTKTVEWETFVYPQALHNPFQGAFTPTARPENHCDTKFDGNNGCANTGNQYAAQFVYPRECSLNDLSGAAQGDLAKVARLRNCSLAFETHPNGFKWQWINKDGPDYGADFEKASMAGNQYGRTSFLFAGVPGMQLPVTFLKDNGVPGDLSIYEKVYNASIFSMYMPIANVADIKNAQQGRNYLTTEFYHTLLMSNHNESDPWQFADGIRGKVLWHNEYRMQGMYQASRGSPKEGVFRDRMFAASFDPATAKAPFHNETCDGCHVRNGSGIPINTEGKLDALLRDFMKDAAYEPSVSPKDYTFTGQIRPMKLVFFDLRRNAKALDGSRYSEPLATPEGVAPPHHGRGAEGEDNLYYNNKVMNYFGDSFHVTAAGNRYTWTYAEINAGSERLVVKDERKNQGLIDPKTGRPKVYKPVEIKLDAFDTGPCQLVDLAPTRKPWPTSCKEVDGNAITAAIAAGEVGFMHLNGKRLGNLSAIEALPSSAIKGFEAAQNAKLGAAGGEIIWTEGSRDGYQGEVRKDCKTKSTDDCFIGRFGWIGDRASLEDQVANAAFVEMNMTTNQGYRTLYPSGGEPFPIRYGYPNCGPADKACVNSGGNGDLTERDIERMADYARWVGNPTRSEFQVALPEVIEGEKVFRKLGCDTCHVIGRVDIVPSETMLNKDFRARLETRIKAASGNDPKAVPFLSYIGTDLLMHDMGYLSQVADAPDKPGEPGKKVEIRQDGVVLPQYKNYVQKIRTPALKGLGFNRFVTDSYRNTKTWINDASSKMDAACDFLLHDGRACDAIEAAFLHDGPAAQKLGLIPNLNALTPLEVTYLRAFLYSL